MGGKLDYTRLPQSPADSIDTSSTSLHHGAEPTLPPRQCCQWETSITPVLHVKRVITLSTRCCNLQAVHVSRRPDVAVGSVGTVAGDKGRRWIPQPDRILWNLVPDLLFAIHGCDSPERQDLAWGILYSVPISDMRRLNGVRRTILLDAETL